MALSTTYVKDAQGATFIAESQRPDGTWRKRRRVKDGYVPQEEVPLYESKGKQFAKSKPAYPVGLSPEIIAASEARREKAEKVKCPIPGLTVNANSGTKSAKKKKKKKTSSGASVDALSETLAKTQISTPETKSPQKQISQIKIAPSSANNATSRIQSSDSSVPVSTDPAKRVKNLRKRLREIEAIEQKIASGELKIPEKDQLEKVARKKEVQKEIDCLLPLLSSA